MIEQGAKNKTRKHGLQGKGELFRVYPASHPVTAGKGSCPHNPELD